MRIRIMFKQICSALLLGMALSVMTVYFVYFHRGSAEDILAANLAVRTGGKYEVESTNVLQRALDNGVDKEEAELIAYQYQRWQRFLQQNEYVSIGNLYDKCEGDDRLLLGKVVMMPDKVEGGVTSRTYLNLTFAEDVVDGEMFIRVSYNGRELYSNHWPLCEVENGFPDRVIYCPIKSGRQRYIKELKIPNYLPKGRYEVKAWCTNQDDIIVGCAFSDFSL